jgi:hypothetical protein
MVSSGSVPKSDGRAGSLGVKGGIARVSRSVNLRGDLAKLSDAELAERLDAAWQAVDEARQRKRSWWQGGLLTFPWRGPLRHPRFYRFYTLLGNMHGPFWLVAAIASVLSGKQFERFLRSDADVDEYLGICEVRDLMDEIERRLAVRGPGRWSARPGGAPRGA